MTIEEYVLNYKTLPESFLYKMQQLLGASYGDYLKSFENQPLHGLRVNRLKTSVSDFVDAAPWPLKPVPWIENGFYYDEGAKPARHPYYYAGLYYLQEPSAMTPASLLPVEPGDCVLDLCAAPGGKSTELAARLCGRGLLFSNDISNSRAKALLKNLEMAGAGNICVTSEAPEKLAQYLEGFFDKILVDAPCSGEGMFRRDSDMVKSWMEKGPDYYRPIQTAILNEAVRMLKPGGLLLYSTCTFDETEDEGVIRSILESHSDMSLVSLPKKEGFEPGVGLTECVRLYPHRMEGEGHFIALMQKSSIPQNGTEDVGKELMMDLKRHGANGKPSEWMQKRNEQANRMCGQASRMCGQANRMCGQANRMCGQATKRNNLTQKRSGPEQEALTEFLKLIQKEYDGDRIYLKDENVYYLPEPLLNADPRILSKIRFLRTGLLLGQLKKGRFEPSQALAMNLKCEEFEDVISFSAEDERAQRYLKGETISFPQEHAQSKNGWSLVCVEHYPLGWAKRSGNNLKNKYYPGWRWI